MGMRDAIRPIRSLFIYPGYRRVVVLADMMVETCVYERSVRHKASYQPQS